MKLTSNKNEKLQQKQKIVIFSDCKDIAFNEIYQNLDQLLYEHGVTNYQIDPLIPIPNFSIVNASFLIRLMSELYSKGTVFLVIMSALPSKPMRIFGETKSGIIFIGNNSGYFNWMFQDKEIKCLYKNLVDHTVDKRSFGGKYVQVPTASRILGGTLLEKLGEKISTDNLSNFTIPEGTVVHCDNFGLMKIFAPKLKGLVEGQPLSIYINNKLKSTAKYTSSLKSHADGTLVLFEGSSLYGLPELGLVRSIDSAKELGVKVGDVITWKVT